MHNKLPSLLRKEYFQLQPFFLFLNTYYPKKPKQHQLLFQWKTDCYMEFRINTCSVKCSSILGLFIFYTDEAQYLKQKKKKEQKKKCHLTI